MPNYTWVAIDIDGKEHKGKQWSPSAHQLEQDLLEKNLGLMHAQRIKLSWHEKLSADEQSQFFQQLYLLVNAGLLVWQALEVLSRYGSRLRRIFAHELELCVKQGSSFAQALDQFPTMVDALSRCLIKSGEESGKLAEALNQLSTFLQAHYELRKKFYSAIRVPIITLAFFCTIVLIIFLAIIPSFEQVLIVTNQEASGGLYKLFAISQFLQTIGLLGLAAGVSGLATLIYFISHTQITKKIFQALAAYTPGISGIYWSYTLAGYFQSVALLIRGGSNFTDALHTALIVTDNRHIHKKLELFTQKISEGHVIDQAFASTCIAHAKPDISPLLAVGNQTGMLAPVLEQSARLLFDHAQQQLNRLTVIIQPILMGILGLLVAALLYTVYVPIIQLPQTLSSSVNF